jgi:formylglycine-generating enzyme
VNSFSRSKCPTSTTKARILRTAETDVIASKMTTRVAFAILCRPLPNGIVRGAIFATGLALLTIVSLLGADRCWRSVWMDETDVTNTQFERFVMATGYITVAERTPTKEEFPDALPESLVAGSAVFTPPPGPVPLHDHLQWWSYVKGANWRHPEGPQSDIKGKVVQVAYEDARAYAKCACKRLPTEAEWEFAARGGLAGKTYAWGDEKDGFAGIAPVKSFPPNGYGLYDMAGNVWQWCGDWYRPDYFQKLAAAGEVTRNPQGPESSFDPAEPGVPKPRLL